MSNELTYVHQVHPDVSFSVKEYTGHRTGNYGSKLPTDYVCTIGKRAHRVYAKSYSNQAVFYVIVKKVKLFVYESHLYQAKKQ